MNEQETQAPAAHINGDAKAGPPPASPTTGPAVDAPLPTLTESLTIMALMLLVAVGCWLLYGPQIRRMVLAVWRFVFGT